MLRCLATSATIAGGGVGGLFIPLVVAGALTGRIVGGSVHALDTSLFVVIGVAAFLGAGYRVPLAAVMFVAEATGRPGFVVPGLLAAVVVELMMGRRSVTTYQHASIEDTSSDPSDQPSPMSSRVGSNGDLGIGDTGTVGDRGDQLGIADAPAGNARVRREAVLERLGIRYAVCLEELAQCNRGLARLVEVRAERPWTDAEHDTYLRLRRAKAELNRRGLHIQQAFERAVVGCATWGHPPEPRRRTELPAPARESGQLPGVPKRRGAVTRYGQRLLQRRGWAGDVHDAVHAGRFVSGHRAEEVVVTRGAEERDAHVDVAGDLERELA